MSREVLDESVSAVMDGEADELELRRVLTAAGEDAAVRERWARYQLARAVMHKQTVAPGLDLAAAVSAAIAAEEAPAVVAASKPPRSSWSQFGRIAVAASVTLAVLAGVRFYNGQDDSAALAPQLAQQPTLPQQELRPVVAPQGPAVLASFPAAPVEAQSAAPAEADELLRELPVDAAKPAVDAAGGQAK
ncbi:sigma-E factor negative regulatory protein RseA [Geopseudomonas sagittaria]|uniref:Sigma-E factor negative regulatory protein RseA n=1 Tax=Geopseudomonas sagittaria TaxID=1135990 RepID=A0A1I5XQM5_9GAMM|nr:RseA family anti-sigma factor [Pseudomonas sagittaria]SFQ34238.1 sigma-E factor negative regulatory protein RseA [Pseudomonas sagittaria]